MAGGNGRLVRWLGSSAVLGLILGFGFVAVKANDASYRAQEATSAAERAVERQHTACLAGNEIRRGQVQLWTYVLDAEPLEPQTTEQVQRREEFRAYVTALFALQDCQALRNIK